MAITTAAGIIAGLQPPVAFYKFNTPQAGRWYSPWTTGAGYPANMAASSAGLAGEVLTTGMFPWTNPSSGNSYLAGIKLNNVIGSTLQSVWFCDRMWQNSGLDPTSASEQIIDSVAFPARDRNGSTNGEGVMVGLEVTTNTGAGTPTITMNYTNSAGTTGQITVTAAVGPSLTAGIIYPIELLPGDIGVRAVHSITFSATMTSGALQLVAFRPVVMLGGVGCNYNFDYLSLGLPRLYDNTVPYIVGSLVNTNAIKIMGSYQITQG